MLNGISEKDPSKIRKVKVINFHGGTCEKIINRPDELIKEKPDDIILRLGINDIANNVNLLNNVKSFSSIFTSSIFFDNR